MNHLNEKIRHGGKEMLRKNWGKAIAATMALAAAIILCSLTENILSRVLDTPSLTDMIRYYRFNWQRMLENALPALAISMGIWLVYLFVVFPIRQGMLRWYLYLTYGESGDDCNLIFSSFDAPGILLKSVYLHFSITLRSWFYISLLCLPSVAMLAMSVYFTTGNPTSMDHIMAVMGSTMGLCLLLLAIITGAIFSRRYFLAPYLIAYHEQLTVSQAIGMSIRATKGYKTNIAWFQLTFAGWWLLCLLGIPLFYTIPYTMACNALYARSLLDFKGLLDRCPVQVQPQKGQGVHKASPDPTGAETMG